MAYEIEIYEIPHTEDGNGYDISKAEVVYTLESDFGNTIAANRKALVIAGTYLSTNGGAVAIKGTIEGESFVHFNGFSGEVNILTKEGFRRHLAKLGMRLEGKKLGGVKKWD